MLPRFLFESPGRIAGHRAGRPRRRGPDRRPSDRTRARFRLEGLEDRCLLSGISGFNLFTGGAGSGPNTWGIAVGPDGNLWFSEATSSKIGMINPTTDAITVFPTPTASFQSPRDRGGTRRQPLVHRERRQ